jgi:hypothetical protein
VGFWAFLFSPKYRTSTLRTWRGAGRPERGWILVEGVVATLVGVGLPVLIAWLVAQELQ